MTGNAEGNKVVLGLCLVADGSTFHKNKKTSNSTTSVARAAGGWQICAHRPRQYKSQRALLDSSHEHEGI